MQMMKCKSFDVKEVNCLWPVKKKVPGLNRIQHIENALITQTRHHLQHTRSVLHFDKQHFPLAFKAW